MRYCAIFLFIGLLVGCATAPVNTKLHPEPVDTGNGLFSLRFNPSESLGERPELSTELGFGDFWERVALEDPTDQNSLVSDLLRQMEAAPQVPVRVRGRLIKRTTRWGQGHQSRIMVLLEISPPKEDK